MKELFYQLDNIFEDLDREDMESPISDGDFKMLAAKLPFEIPRSLEQIYKWHNGIDCLIPNYDFMPLSGAIAEYDKLIRLREEFQDEEFFNDNFLPIFWEDKSYLVLDCDPSYEQSIYYIAFDTNEMPEKYESIEQMIEIIVDAYLSRAFYMEDGSLVKNSVLLRKIENKYISSERQAEREEKWQRICIDLRKIKDRDVEDIDREQIDFEKTIIIDRLYRTYDERAIDYLMEFLNDDNPEIVSKAAYGLGELRARERLPELLYLLNHPDRSVRCLTTCAIGNIASAEDELLIQPLLKLLTDESGGYDIIQINASEALSRLKNSKAVTKLIDLLLLHLSEEESNIKQLVISTIGQMGDIGVIEKLEKHKTKVSPDNARLIDRAIKEIEEILSIDY